VAGRTIFDAVRELSLLVPKRLFFAQNREVLLGEELARQGLEEVIDFFDRNVQMRKLAYVLVVKGKIEEVIDVPNPHEVCPALRIEAIIRQQQQSSHFPLVKLGDFLGFLATEGQEAYCAVVRVKKNPTQVLRPRKPFNPAPEPYLEIKVTGTALFRKDKLVGYLNEHETRGLLWARGEVQGGHLNLPCPAGKGKPVSLNILRSEARMIPEITDDGRLRVTVEIREEADLAETGCPFDLREPGVVKKLEVLQAEAIEREVMSAVRRAQEYKSDVFGFGAAFHRRYPQEWREIRNLWAEEFFPLVEVKVVVDAKIRRIGLRLKPLVGEELR
jgi:spore germination protein KC